MKIPVGADDAGKPLLAVVKAYIEENYPDVEIEDLSEPVGNAKEYYPDVAERVARAVAEEGLNRGILICGTGLGMAMTACKVPGVRAGTCHDVYSAERVRKSNNAQILTMGARVIGPELAKTITEAWMQSEYKEGTRSEPKVARMDAIDAKYLKKP